jgi:hypothetical protein
MPKCKTCDADVEPEDVFCASCGNAISGAQKIEFNDKPREDKPTFKGVDMEEMPEVYHSSHRTFKAKAVLISVVAVVSILLILVVFGLVKEIGANAKATEKNCPFECCLSNSTFLEKTCENDFASCVDNKCVLGDCPFECCDSPEFVSKSCDDKKQYCINDTCIKKDCPFECCLGSEGYQQLKCANGGSCVNNECLLDPCPSEYECCQDDLEYEDKPCSPGNICSDRECKFGVIEIIKRYIKGIFNVFKLIL